MFYSWSTHNKSLLGAKRAIDYEVKESEIHSKIETFARQIQVLNLLKSALSTDLSMSRLVSPIQGIR